jgi:uncharacterized coiled-coil protein SlyX
MSNIISAGINLVNAERQKTMETQAANVIAVADQINLRIEGQQKRIETLQGELRRLSRDAFDVSTIFGASLPTTNPPTMGFETIARVISDMNRRNQDHVAVQSAQLTSAILREQELIKKANEEKAKLVEELNKMEARMVTSEQIVGQ